MKNFVLIVLGLISLVTSAQVTENFTDGDFTTNPIWSGDTNKFIVNGTNTLQSNGNSGATDTMYLTTPSKSIINAEWTFRLDMNYNPTSSNYFKVFLVSDNANLESSVNGYFIRFGESSGDTMRFFRKDGNSEVELMSGVQEYASNVKATVKVTRDSLGNWKMYSDPASGTAYVVEDSVFDNTYTSTDYFGFYYRYSTTSRFDDFLVDDINVTGTFLVDNTPPSISSVNPISSTELDVYFSEKVDQTTAETLVNYQVNNSIGIPSIATLDGSDPKLVHLSFVNPFANSTSYTLTANNIEDLNSNALNNEQKTFTFFIPQAKDIIINELFPDPSPSVGMPEAEFVELYNNANESINITGMQLTDGSSTATLSNYTLQSGSYVIICANADTTIYSLYGAVIGVSNFPSLNNTGDNIQLLFSNGGIMDEVNYSSDWYKDDAKSGGGYTLELIDPNNPCAGDNNWAASENASGGTPGKVNSINASNPDLTAPILLKAVAVDENTVIVYYNEKLDAATVMASNYIIDNSITISKNGLNDGLTTDTLYLSSPLQNKTLYTVTVSNVYDCSGNNISDNNSAEFALPEAFENGDIIINEILFNARTGGNDFVELYNKSDKFIDLQELYFLRNDDSLFTFYSIASDFLILAPESYLAISEDIKNIEVEYPLGKPENYYEINDLPSYADSEGEVIIGFIDSGDTIVADSVYYTDDYHFELIDDVNGVSLERIDFNQSSTNVSNWHSAASSVGYATPGYQNSNTLSINSIADDVVISPEIFTPNDDGYKDFTTISFSFQTQGNVANITIFDSYGRMIKRLVQNELLPIEGFYQWDGTNMDGRKALVGNYIVLFEIFDVNGNKQKFKKVVSVGADL